MAYTKIGFKDRIDSKPDTYLVNGVTAKIEKDDTGLIQVGTNLNAQNLEHIEEGIYQNSLKIEEHESSLSDKANQQDLDNFIDTKGNPNGLASLDESGKVLSQQLPTIENLVLIANVSPSTGNIVTFDNIPQDYKKLILEIKGYVQHASAKVDAMKLIVNGLSTPIYDYGFISNTKIGDPVLTNNLNQNMGYAGLGNGIATSYSNSSTSIFIITFENYKDLINYMQFNGFTQVDSSICYQNVGNTRIRSQAPITKIDVLLNTATFCGNCTFKMYGVK